MVLNSQRTLYATTLLMNMMLHAPHKDLANTTLNEKFKVLPNQHIPEGTYPKLQYMAIGIGGTEIISAAPPTDNNDFTNPINSYPYKFSQHSAIDGALFEHIPFIMRPVTSDLTVAERKNYRMRVVETVNGITYASYYLKLISKYNNKNALFEINTTNSNSILSYFDTKTVDTILNPIPRAISADYLDMTTNKYYAKTTKINFYLHASELKELSSVLKTKYNSTNKYITEIGLCAGIEAPQLDTTVEAVNTTIMYHVGVDINTESYVNSSKDLVKAIEIAGMEPLIK